MVPRAPRGALVRGFAEAIGVPTDDLGFAFEDPATAAILGGMSRVCGARDLNLLLVPMGPSAPGVRTAALASAAVDGFVVHSVPESTPGLDLVGNRGLPTLSRVAGCSTFPRPHPQLLHVPDLPTGVNVEQLGLR